MADLAVGQAASFTSGSGYEYSGYVGHVVAVGPRMVTIDVRGRYYTKCVDEVYPGRIDFARDSRGGFLRESAFDYAARIDEAIKATHRVGGGEGT